MFPANLKLGFNDVESSEPDFIESVGNEIKCLSVYKCKQSDRSSIQIRAGTTTNTEVFLCSNYDFEGKADLRKGNGNPKRKLGVTTKSTKIQTNVWHYFLK